MGLLIADIDLHLQGRSVQFRSNIRHMITDQDHVIAGPKDIPSGGDALVMIQFTLPKT